MEVNILAFIAIALFIVVPTAFFAYNLCKKGQSK